MARQLPTGERPRVFEQYLLLVGTDVENDRAAVSAHEVVVPDREASFSLGDVLVKQIVAARADVSPGASA